MVAPVIALITATNFVPSEDDATLLQYAAGAFVCLQVTPESVELQIPVVVPVISLITATNFVPSEDDATLLQFAVGAAFAPVLFVHVAPESLDVQMPL